jgi:hypothetical protein
MNKQEQQLAAIQDMRNMMERSSRFLSLSGLAGVFVGIIAIIGIIAAYLFLGLSILEPGYYQLILGKEGIFSFHNLTFIVVDCLIVLVVSVFAGSFMAMSNAKKKGYPIWDPSAKRLLNNLALPLLTGALFSLVLLYHGYIQLIAPITLIFYGLALLNASKYTIDDIRYLGIIEIFIGLLASIFVDYGLLFWAFGFGILHIVYGLTIYFKYEQ